MTLFNLKSGLFLVYWLGTIGWAFQAIAPELDKQITMEACEVPGFSGKVLCGTFEVFENRKTQEGRKIALKVVVMPAKTETSLPDPVFILLGGPGQGAASFAGFIASRLQAILPDRDMVFVDTRGTGASNPLNCAFSGPEDQLQTYLGEMFDPDYVRACRQELEKKADLSLYTTTYAMADLDDIRQALGYEKINLSGGSYGTRAALEYMRLFPEHVRTAVLNGLAPVSIPMPFHFARDAQTALDEVFADCAADPSCAKAYPELEKEAARVFAAFDEGPIIQTVKNPFTKEDETVVFKRGVFVTALRAMLYSSFRAAKIPLFLHKASKGDFEPFIIYAAQYAKGLLQGLSDGLYLCITCAEDLPYLDLASARKEAKGTFLGTFRIDQQWEACQMWERGVIDEAFREPLVSDIPVLLISGEVDPVTPPYMGELVAKGFPNSVHLVAANAAHGVSLAGKCISEAISSFVAQGHGRKIEKGCLQKVKRPPFAIEEEGK